MIVSENLGLTPTINIATYVCVSLRMRKSAFFSQPRAVPLGRPFSSSIKQDCCYHSFRGLRTSPRHYHHLARPASRQIQTYPLSCWGAQSNSCAHNRQQKQLSHYYSSLAFNGDSTIYALSTAPGRAAIGIIRISGPACLQVSAILGPKWKLSRL